MAWNEIGAWTRLHRLGVGGFGSVYLGKRDSDGKLFAVKTVYFVPQSTSPDPAIAADELRNEEYNLAGLINEIRTLRKLKSPYIIRYLGCGTSKGPAEMNSRLVLDCYLEYLPRGSLYSLVRRFHRLSLPEHFIRAYTKDILKGLAYLHFNKIVHGDLKCNNVLVDATSLKIADFGSVKDVRTSFFKKILFGTRGYRAPEVLDGSEQTYASDIFSLGCTVMEMATGRMTDNSFMDDYRWDKYSAIPNHLSDICVDFLIKCFYENPSRRPTASRLLTHPFITEPIPPNYQPFAVPLDRATEAKILQAGPDLIIPPNDLNPELPDAPFSPIHTLPLKRRRIDEVLFCTPSEDEVEHPQPPNWVLPQNPPVMLRYNRADDEHSDIIRPPPYDPQQNQNPDPQQNPNPDPQQNPNPVRRQNLRNRRLLNLRRLPDGPWKSEVASSVSYQGHEVTFPTVAQLADNDATPSNQDTDPLVVKICDEFGIPLPPEYQKWILDPLYNNPNQTPSGTLLNTLARAGRAGLNFIFRT